MDTPTQRRYERQAALSALTHQRHAPDVDAIITAIKNDTDNILKSLNPPPPSIILTRVYQLTGMLELLELIDGHTIVYGALLHMRMQLANLYAHLCEHGPMVAV